MKKKLIFIINPISGIGRQKKIEKIIEKNLNLAQFDYTIRYTEYAHHGRKIAREAADRQECDAIIAVGGDGSVNDVVNGLHGYNMTMGIIPCGSGNGLARDLKIPLQTNQAVRAINYYNVIPIDTIQLNNHIYVSIAGVGFDALVARKMKLAKKRGLTAYANIVLNDYPLSKENIFHLQIDGEILERKAWFISFANSSQFGYNTTVAPLADLSDGLIDICIVKKIPLAHLPLTAPLVYLNHFDLSQHVEIIKAKEVKVLDNDYQWVNVDGEGLRMERELTFQVYHNALNIIKPIERPNLIENIENKIEDLEKLIEDSRYFK